MSSGGGGGGCCFLLLLSKMFNLILHLDPGSQVQFDVTGSGHVTNCTVYV